MYIINKKIYSAGQSDTFNANARFNLFDSSSSSSTSTSNRSKSNQSSDATHYLDGARQIRDKFASKNFNLYSPMDAIPSKIILNEIHQDTLTRASKHGDIEMINELLKLDTNPNYIDSMGTTPLMVASAHGQLDVVNLLVNNLKIDPDLGAEMSYLSGSQVCRKNSEPPLHHAAKNGHIDVIKLLINSGANINKLSINGVTALDLAIKDDRSEVVDFLLQKKAVSGSKSVEDENTIKPLCLAIRYASPKTIEMILNKYDSLYNNGSHSHNPLDYLFYSYFPGNRMSKAIEVLARHGANFNQVDQHGRLLIERFLEYPGELKSIIMNGANVDFINSQGLKPSEVAKERKISIVVDILKKNETNEVFIPPKLTLTKSYPDDPYEIVFPEGSQFALAAAAFQI